MRSSLSTKTSSQMNPSQHRLFSSKRVWALGCAAVGGVGVLWLPGVAQMAGITPEPGANQVPFVAPLPEMSPATQTPAVPAPPAPTSRAMAATAQQESHISIEMRDAPVIDLLMLIAAQGGVDISIGSDVEATLKIPGIRLTDVTPAEAIRKAAETASLQWKKLGDKSYLVGKSLSGGGNSSSTGSSQGIEGIKPINENWLDVPLQSPSTQLPSYASQGSTSNGLVPLNTRRERAERKIRPIKIRNVRSGLMAWWLDPKNQEMPIEMEASAQAKKLAISPYPLKPGVDPNVMSAINGNAPAGMPFGNPYAANNGLFNNPYMNAGATHPWLQPNYRSSFLFGGGGGGGGGFGGGGGGAGGGGFGGGMLELGTDAQGNQEVDQIVSIDAQNVLLVYGTDEGIRQLNEIIDFLDRPIRQVEIESQFIDISVSDAKAFGLQFYNRNSILNTDDEDEDNGTINPTNALGVLPGLSGGASTLIFTRGSFQTRLQALAQSGRARIINSPRVTTMNNLTASLVSQQQTPVVLTSSDTGIGGQVGESQNAFFLTTMIGIQVTPTIQNDDTITVFLTPQVSVQSQTPTFGGSSNSGDDDDDDDSNAASSIPSVSSQFVTTVANVKDNDVIVLGGLRTRTQNIARSRIPILSKIPLIGRLFRSTNTTDVDRELVIFLTARILRRSDDVTPIQGP